MPAVAAAGATEDAATPVSGNTEKNTCQQKLCRMGTVSHSHRIEAVQFSHYMDIIQTFTMNLMYTPSGE